MIKVIQNTETNPYNKPNYKLTDTQKGKFMGKSYSLLTYHKEYTGGQRAYHFLKALALTLSTLFFGVMNKGVRDMWIKSVKGHFEKKLCIYEPLPIKDISTFIKENYDVKFRGEDVAIDDFSDVEEFLLCDNHGSPGHNQLNSLFINTYAKKNDVVMVEAVRSMQKVKPNDAYQSVWLDTKAQILGWDIGSIKKIIKSSVFAQSGEEVTKSEICARQLLDPEFTGYKEKVEKIFIQSIKKQLSIIPKLNLQNQQILGQINSVHTQRTTEMEQSLIKAKNVGNHTFIIAGSAHLLQDKNELVSTPESFFTFLKNRKVVVLAPKDNVRDTIGDPVTKLYAKILKMTDPNLV